MSGNKPNSSSFVKKLLLGKSETFCMNPWIHLHTTPTGIAAPCCIAESCATDEGMGNSRKQSLMELVNSDKMNKLRLDMLTGVKSEECKKCYEHEAQDVDSFRVMTNRQFKHAMDDVIEDTNLEDGSLKKFKMRYFDIRFSNICNFKCRTCGSAFSTQWEQEDLKNNVWYAKVHPKNDKKEFLQDVIDQIDNMEIAYFAGGEPLITDQHYVLLEEMIRRNRHDITLKYNTNLSNLKFKNKDILGLWKHFKNRVEIYASIDHYGPRAEYIRHGTVWDEVEENFLIAKKTPFINIQMNTVLSVFNALTFFDFYKYIIDKKMYTPKDSVFTVYNMATPDHLTCHILPEEYKLQAVDNINKTIAYMKDHNFNDGHISQLEVCPQWIMSQNTWDDQKNKFREEVKRLDAIRGEAFLKTFPEIGELYKVNVSKMWPV